MTRLFALTVPGVIVMPMTRNGYPQFAYKQRRYTTLSLFNLILTDFCLHRVPPPFRHIAPMAELSCLMAGF